MNTKKELDCNLGYISIFSKSSWEELDTIVDTMLQKSPELFETPRFGDSRNEYVDLRTIRFVVRKNGLSEIINNPYSSRILTILNQSNYVQLIEEKTKIKNLAILRAQLNVMEKNSVLGIHTDKESDSAFEITSLIRTKSDYLGGELYIYGDAPKVINQKNHSVFLMDSSLEHEVKKVFSGQRNSLIVLLGKK